MLQFEMIQDYYGRLLENKNDLKTTACCSIEKVPTYLKDMISKIHPEVQAKFYGCGVPVPPRLESTTVLDLGCGTGRDCFVLSFLAGESGQVIGVDMTGEQLEIANRYSDYHQEVFGKSQSKLDFRKGFIEDLSTCGIKDESIDVVVSNCVINLSPSKEMVFKEIFRVLKPGGELYFSDVFCDRRLPESFRNDPVLLGECLGGALYLEDFRAMLARAGCQDFRVLSESSIDLSDKEVVVKLGNASFTSMTVRAFKLELEASQEDYGHIAIYQGDMKFHPHGFKLDQESFFETGRPTRVSLNTANILRRSRYSKHFSVLGQTDRHFGPFERDGSCAVPGQDITSLGACC